MFASTNANNFSKALEQVTQYWSPRVIAQVNNQYVKVAKLKGELVWHKHEHEDEMFLIVYGKLKMQLESGDIWLAQGDFYVVPKNTMHNPVAEEECGLVLIESVTTLHTGDVTTDRSKSIAEQLATD